MECTIGWIKTPKGYLLFKNRDTSPELVGSSEFYKDDRTASIAYKKRKGHGIGINKHGVGVASARGPDRKDRKGYQDWKRYNEISEKVLKEAKTLSEAREIFVSIYLNEKIGDSANIIICNKEKAEVIELGNGKANISSHAGSVCRTNHFINMEEANSDYSGLERSKARYLTAISLLKNARSKEDLIPILSFHSKRNRKASICRHDKSLTVASFILELKDNQVEVNYTEKPPCKAEKYRKETVKWQK